MTDTKKMLFGWFILILMTIASMVSFYTAKYVDQRIEFTMMGAISTAIGWYYYGLEHGKMIYKEQHL